MTERSKESANLSRVEADIVAEFLTGSEKYANPTKVNAQDGYRVEADYDDGGLSGVAVFNDISDGLRESLLQ